MAPHPPDDHDQKPRDQSIENIHLMDFSIDNNLDGDENLLGQRDAAFQGHWPDLRVKTSVHSDTADSTEQASVLKDAEGYYKTSITQSADGLDLKPFLQTSFGKLPPEIREKVFIELLATPPSYAGHDFATSPPKPEMSPRAPAPKKFVHIKASWHQVTRTCRQIYIESRPVFFASKSYYLADAQELEHFFHYVEVPWRTTFRCNTITALCLKGLVAYLPLFTEKQIDDIFSDPTDMLGVYNTRQELEAMTFETLDIPHYCPLRRLNSLRTVSLCMRVGEEMLYVNLLYFLSGMRKGLVEFVNASQWLIRPQDPEDVWRIQYACFINGDFARGKDNEDVPYDTRCIELETTDIDSRAPGLKEGDERYVEVQIQLAANQQQLRRPLDGDENDIGWETASDQSDMDPSTRDSTQAQPETPQDEVEDIAQAEISENDHMFAVLEPEPNRTNQSSFLRPQSEAASGPQSDTDTDQEEGQILLGPGSEEVSGTQPETQSDHQATDYPSSRPSIRVTHDAPTDNEDDRRFPLDSEDADNHVQTDTKASDPAPQVTEWQHDDAFHAESATETDQMQRNPNNEVKSESRRTTIKYLPGQKRRLLLDVLDTPNPYTEEEMESYQAWQQLAIGGAHQKTERDSHREEQPSAPIGKRQERQAKGPGEASLTATPKEKHPSPASPQGSEMPSKSVPMATLFLLFLFLAIMSRHPEWLSNAGQDRKGSSQQF